MEICVSDSPEFVTPYWTFFEKFACIYLKHFMGTNPFVCNRNTT